MENKQAKLSRRNSFDVIGENSVNHLPAVYTTADVINLLKVSRRTLQKWRDSGLIEFSAIGNKFYYKSSAIEKMLEKHLITS